MERFKGPEPGETVLKEGMFEWRPQDVTKVNTLLKAMMQKRVPCKIFLTSERIVACHDSDDPFGLLWRSLYRLVAGRRIAFRIPLRELTCAEIAPRTLVDRHLVLNAADGSKYHLFVNQTQLSAKLTKVNKTDEWCQKISETLQGLRENPRLPDS
jgi:hypothetical protein